MHGANWKKTFCASIRTASHSTPHPKCKLQFFWSVFWLGCFGKIFPSYSDAIHISIHISIHEPSNNQNLISKHFASVSKNVSDELLPLVSKNVSHEPLQGQAFSEFSRHIYEIGSAFAARTRIKILSKVSATLPSGVSFCIKVHECDSKIATLLVTWHMNKWVLDAIFKELFAAACIQTGR